MIGQRGEQRCRRCRTRLARDNRTGHCAPCQLAGRDRFAHPLSVPAEFWDHPAIREAIAARHMGRLIRAYRCHPIHGLHPLPQAVVAGWIGVTQAQLSRIEKQSPVVHLDRLIHCARALRIPADRLWFALPESNGAFGEKAPAANGIISDGEFSPSLLWASTNTAEIVSQFTRRDLTVDRREAAKNVVGVVFGAALLEPMERWLGDPASDHGDGRPSGVGYQEVGQIELVARMFREWDDQFGGGLRRKAVIGQLNEVSELLQDSHPAEIRRRLFGTVAHLAETAAVMSWDSGQQALAQRYYILALHAAKPAGDFAFAANIMAGMARQLLYLGQTGDALELIRVAQDSAKDATSTVRAMLYTREAWAYSKQGRISAFRRATDNAQEMFAAATPDEDPYWITYFDAAELAGTTGGRFLDLAHTNREMADEAVAEIESAIDLRRPGRLRSSALDHIGLAEARLIQGELDEAVRLGHSAADVVEQTCSDRARVKFAEFHQHVATFAEVAAVAELRERIGTLLAKPPTTL